MYNLIMKKVTAIIGTHTTKATYRAVQEFENNLKQYGDVVFEYVFLDDHHLDFCRGCKQCFIKGEEYCPAKDDRDVLLDKMEHSDGVILATPTYTFQVAGRMKNFLDRLGFICHRPRFFGKTYTAIVTQGIYGGGNVLKYLHFTGGSLGFNVSKGCCITALDPMTESQQKKLSQKVKKAATRFYKNLQLPKPQPSFLELMIFRMARTSIKFVDQNYRDHQYYKEKGWFEADFYYPTSLGLVKRLTGNLFDLVGQQIFKHPQQK
jgi:multimeric flavodoxin WrbA